jgi:putative ABC transport system permease protein
LIWDTDGDTTYYVDVVGVAKNFHFTSLRNEIKPFGFLVFPRNQNNFNIKLSSGNITATLAQLEDLWKSSFPEVPFEYIFLDETFSKMYAAEARFQKVFISLVILGIIISCLGLFALATFSAEQRVKEIGIRKVLGASVTHVVALLSKDFLKLVIISLVLAIPISIYAMQTWLEGFAYRVSIAWWIFVVAAFIAFMIAFLTISTQAFKAAIADPAKSLRSE